MAERGTSGNPSARPDGANRKNKREADESYELAEVPEARANTAVRPTTFRQDDRKDLHPVLREPRWCPACGYDLTMVDESPCPRCERRFIPGDKSTYSTDPIEIKHPFWRTSPRVAGALFVVAFLIGRATINGSGAEWASWMNGAGGQFGVIPGVMLCLLLIPWLIVTILLGLVGLGEYYNPKMVYCLLIGAVLGAVCCLFLNPIILFIGVVAGLFAGFLRCWLAKF